MFKYILFVLSFTLCAQEQLHALTEHQWLQSSSFQQRFACPPPTQQSDCEICQGNLPGFNFLDDLTKSFCEIDQKVSYQFPSDLNYCYQDQDLTGNSAYEICSCLGNSMLHNSEKYPPLPADRTEATLKSLAGGAIFEAVEQAFNNQALFQGFLGQNGINTECDIFSQIREKVEKNQCGAYNQHLKVALELEREAPAPIKVDYNFFYRYARALARKMPTNHTLDPRAQFAQIQQLLEYAHLNGDFGRDANNRYRKVQEALRQFHVEAENAQNTRFFQHDTDSHNQILQYLKETEFEETIIDAGKSFCSHSSNELEYICSSGAAQEGSQVEKAQKLLEDPRFQLHAFRWQNNGRELTLDKFQSPEDRAQFIAPGVLLLCQSFKDSLLSKATNCDLQTREGVAACGHFDTHKRMMCHSIISMFDNRQYDYLKKKIEKVLEEPVNKERLSQILMPDGRTCEVSPEANQIYDIVITTINNDFSYIEGKAPVLNDAINEDSTINRPSYTTNAPSNSESFSDEDAHAMGQPASVSIPMRPQDSAAKTIKEEDQIEHFVPNFDPNYVVPTTSSETTPSSNTLGSNHNEQESSKTEAQLAALMEKIEKLNNKLDTNKTQSAQVSEQLTNPNITSEEKARLEIEKIKLENERLRLEIQRQKLVNQKAVYQEQLAENEESAAKKEAIQEALAEPSPTRTANTTGNSSADSTTTAAVAPKITTTNSETSISHENKNQTTSSNNGFTLAGVYVSSAKEVSDFLSGNKTYRKHKIILDDPKNKENVIVCILPPETLDAALKNKKQEFSYQDYLCGDPIKKSQISDVTDLNKQEVSPAPNAPVEKSEAVPAEENSTNEPGARFQSVKDIINQTK